VVRSDGEEGGGGCEALALLGLAMTGCPGLLLQGVGQQVGYPVCQPQLAC
jgi:hypothetical protein